MSTTLLPTAAAKRAQQPDLVATWSIGALTGEGPLSFPVDPELPASPKPRYRSSYQPPDPTSLDSSGLDQASEFEIALRLIDFSALERALAHIYKLSGKGQIPFHPVSLFLAVCLRLELQLSWRALARLLRSDTHGAGWRRLLGFRDRETPSASGLRSFFQRVGPEMFAQLCPQFTDLLRSCGRFPEQSTFPSDPPTRGVSVCQDGMLHPARHRHTCQLATDACFTPLAEPPGEDGQGEVPSRPCRAREHNQPGCTCAEPTCQARCTRASTCDPDARLIHYAGRSRQAGPSRDPTGPSRPPARGIDVFGYRSLAERVLDDRFAVAWTVQSDSYPANTDERSVFTERVQALTQRFPDLDIGEWLDDAGVSFGECLDTIWELGALRMVDIRADPSDQNVEACRKRGYDEHGRPLCPHGYRLRANGYDAERRRTKYICHQACRREPLEKDGPIQPVISCPFVEPANSCGFVRNVGRTLPDGSSRLAREIPYGSPAWKQRYGRRNLAESRNGQLEGMGLKRMRSFGQERAGKDVQLADFVINLRTLGRLVREAMNQTAC